MMDVVKRRNSALMGLGLAALGPNLANSAFASTQVIINEAGQFQKVELDTWSLNNSGGVSITGADGSVVNLSKGEFIVLNDQLYVLESAFTISDFLWNGAAASAAGAAFFVQKEYDDGPVVVNSSDLLVRYDATSTANVQNHFSSPNGLELTYSMQSGSVPDGLVLNANGTITGTSDLSNKFDSSAPITITVKATDSDGKTVEKEIDIHVQLKLTDDDFPAWENREEDHASLSIKGGEGADYISTGSGFARVKTGVPAADANISLGAGDDALKLGKYSAGRGGNIKIDAGEGNDLLIMGSELARFRGEAHIKAGAGADVVSFLGSITDTGLVELDLGASDGAADVVWFQGVVHNIDISNWNAAEDEQIYVSTSNLSDWTYSRSGDNVTLQHSNDVIRILGVTDTSLTTVDDFLDYRDPDTFKTVYPFPV